MTPFFQGWQAYGRRGRCPYHWSDDRCLRWYEGWVRKIEIVFAVAAVATQFPPNNKRFDPTEVADFAKRGIESADQPHSVRLLVLQPERKIMMCDEWDEDDFENNDTICIVEQRQAVQLSFYTPPANKHLHRTAQAGFLLE